MKFQGYFPRWDRCSDCGMKLIKSGNSLRHRNGWLQKHFLIMAKKRGIRIERKSRSSDRKDKGL